MLKNGDPRRSIVSGRPTEVGFQQVLGARLPELPPEHHRGREGSDGADRPLPSDRGRDGLPRPPPARIFTILDHDASRGRRTGRVPPRWRRACRQHGDLSGCAVPPLPRPRGSRGPAAREGRRLAGHHRRPGRRPAGGLVRGGRGRILARMRGLGAHGVGCAMGVGGILVGCAVPSRGRGGATDRRGGSARRGRLRERRRHGRLSRPAHTGLLASGIPIVENLRGLERLPREGFVFWAPPVGIVRGAAFPVRAFAEVP
jgi:hypothetical protein